MSKVAKKQKAASATSVDSRKTKQGTNQRSTQTNGQGTTRDERLYNEILDAILDHRLSPGIKLKEDELASIFSVSRTVVRRALLRLSHDRIVDIEPNRGATVIRPDIRKAREILGARRLIERELIREATLTASGKSLDELRLCVENEKIRCRTSTWVVACDYPAIFIFAWPCCPTMIPCKISSRNWCLKHHWLLPCTRHRITHCVLIRSTSILSISLPKVM